jgi:hypothetical protein
MATPGNHRRSIRNKTFAFSLCYALQKKGRRKMEGLTMQATSPSDMPKKVQEQERLVDAVLGGVDELTAYAGKRPIQCFTIKMPFPLYLKFKALNKKLKDAAAEQDREKYTMTAWVNSAVDRVIVPALEERLLRDREEQAQQEAAG